VCAGNIPDDIHALMKPHIVNQENTLRAALEYDRALVYTVFENEPLVKGRCETNEIRVLVDDMISNTLKFLPKEWQSV
jgi:alpha-galactosidase